MKARQFISLMILIATLYGPLAAHAADDGLPRPVFSTVMNDLPIMPGLTEKTDSALIFDKPDGRIIETAAFGPLPAQKVRDFYARALPALGWIPIQDNIYARRGERLSLSFAARGDMTEVRINLEPATR